MFPALTVKLLPEQVRQFPLLFKEEQDDFDLLHYAQINAGGIVVLLQRYNSEPPDIYTLMLDAKELFQKHGIRPLDFAGGVLKTLGIDFQAIVWINQELDRLYPVQPKSASTPQQSPSGSPSP